MKLREKFRRFWTMDVHNHEGFTLVELIIVIAILAILSGVAVAGYSSYIKKANVTADKTMVAEIINAVTLAYYSGDVFSNNYSGYVVLTNDTTLFAQASSTELEKVLQDAFGSNWQRNVGLKHDGWKDATTMLSLAYANALSGSVPGSTYITQVGTDKLMTDVQDCALALSGFLNAFSGGDVPSAITTLKSQLGDELGAEYEAILNAAGYSAENNYAGATSDVLSNAAVFVLAQDLTEDDYTDIMEGFYSDTDPFVSQELTLMDDNLLPQLAAKYAAMEALVNYLGDKDCTEAFESINMEGDAASILTSINNAGATITEKVSADIDENEEMGPLATKYFEYYMGDGTNKPQAQLDGEAYVSIMQSVDKLSGDYVSADNLKNENLFVDSDVASRLDSYAAASSLKGQLNPEASDLLNKIAAAGYTGSAVVILVTVVNGELTCVALPAEVAG